MVYSAGYTVTNDRGVYLEIGSPAEKDWRHAPGFTLMRERRRRRRRGVWTPLTQSKALFILLTKSTERVYCFHFECISESESESESFINGHTTGWWNLLSVQQHKLRGTSVSTSRTTIIMTITDRQFKQ